MESKEAPWECSYGVWMIRSNGRTICSVQAYEGRVIVTIDVRLAYQVIKGRAGSVEQGKRHAEKWLLAWYRRPEVDSKPDWIATRLQPTVRSPVDA